MQASFDGKMLRPRSAPTYRVLSQMDCQEPVFGKTFRQMRDVPLREVNYGQALAPSAFREKDMYQTTYSHIHRPFGRDERMVASSMW